MPQQLDTQSASNPQALKHIFNKLLLERMSQAIGKVYPPFNQQCFLELAQELETVEMKGRVLLIRNELRNQLPQDFSQAVKILLQSTECGALNGFALWPYTEFIQAYGLEEVKLSLDALKELTRLFTSEFAVRPFLKRHPSYTLQYLETCALDKDVHVRRWACEGTRPRLPWGERLQEFVRDPSPPLLILERLKFDSELYVRKSVSNHLNDIAKDHPDWVITLLSSWKKSAGTEDAAKIEWIIHRALRTLIKKGHPEALKLIDVSQDAQIKITEFKINQKKFTIGEQIEFEFRLQSLSANPQKVVIDYIIHFVKANQSKSPKVFKLKALMLPAKGVGLITKSHHLKKVTTRTHYPGLHLLEIQVNGRVLHQMDWELRV
ncbi:DNA alkylation repair protein [Candidatus Paracaedibacter symbiosus]|uniref:DNA alkylation repair protein n=1 Tax=Candidatus Paracaedibacter symbiosus TaxID=244582 RepID=UPI000509F16C|nr:DNA alkylation repair protein [Candidatus Paracaedibacter symbiosus]